MLVQYELHTKTKREEKEIKAKDKAKEKERGLNADQPTTQSQHNHGPEKPDAEENRGLNPSIADIKIKHATKIPWGTLYAEITSSV